MDSRWIELLIRDFSSNGGSAEVEPAAAFAEYTRYVDAPCRRCKRLLWVHRRNDWRRCLCVAWRGYARMPLTIVSLSLTRCGDGSFCDWEGHAGARAAASALFHVQFRSVDELADNVLMDADLAIVHTTAARNALSKEEQESLGRFCEGGGTALLNCFSNWTNNGGYGREVVSFLGVQPEPRSVFNRARISKLCTAHDTACADLSLAGPWCAYQSYLTWKEVHAARDRNQPPADNGLLPIDEPLELQQREESLELRIQEARNPRRAHEAAASDVDFYITAADEMLSRQPRGEFANCGETFFNAARPLLNGSAVRLCESTNFESYQRCLGPLWFSSPHSNAQVLVCSNMHWIADPHVWNGGLIQQTGNTTLWLNLCAAACREL